MKNLLKMITIISILCFFIGSAQAYYRSENGLTLTGTAPSGGGLPVLTTPFNNAMDAAFDELVKYSNQPELAKGFANSSAFASQAATQQGYQDYSLFAVTAGFMASAQVPSYNKDYYKNLDDKIKQDGDLNAGVGASVAMLNVGINAGFLYPGLYLNAKFGYLSQDFGSKVTIKNTLIGVGANYTWIKTWDFLFGLAKWRGVSFGTGLLYNYNNTDVKLKMNNITTTNVAPNTDLVLNPSFIIGVESNTFSIPFDVTTSVQLLWFLNFNLGAGIDFTFGATDIKLKSDGNAIVTGSGAPAPGSYNPGTFNIDAGTKGKSPDFAHFRITSGVGFNISVVKIDVPVAYYPFEKAFAVGLTAGVVY